MEEAVDVDGLIEALIDREGGYVDHPADKGGPAGWSTCDAAKAAQDAALARTTAQFHRMAGVFVLPATLNGTVKSYFVVDSGAASG